MTLVRALRSPSLSLAFAGSFACSGANTAAHSGSNAAPTPPALPVGAPEFAKLAVQGIRELALPLSQRLAR